MIGANFVPAVDSKVDDLSVAAAVCVVAAGAIAADAAVAAVIEFQVESQVDLIIAIDSGSAPVRG